MKRLVLDHYRRWAWVLALGAAGEFALGCLIATGPEYAFEFGAFLLSLWTGPLLLSFDLKRSFLRTIAVLPLTGQQVGRGWWLATVPLPGVILTALLFSGAATYSHFPPDKAFPWRPLILTGLFTLVWLGTQFTLIFNATRGFGGNWREFFSTGFISWLAMLTFFGSMVFCHDATKNPLKATVLLGVAALLPARWPSA